MPLPRVATLALLAFIAVASFAAPAGASDPPAAPLRTMIISLPDVTWEQIERQPVPHLRALLEPAAVASLAPARTRDRPDGFASTYLTFGAGTRATAPDRVTAESSGDGGVVVKEWRQLVARNDQALYEAQLGAVGNRLKREGVGRAVISAAGSTDAAALLALADGDGRVPYARLDGLSERDSTAPGGTVTDPAAVRDAVATVWNNAAVAGGQSGRVVVLVEAADLVRNARASAGLPGLLANPARNAALARADALVGQLAELIDPRTDSLMVVGPASEFGPRTLTISAAQTPSSDPGWLGSATTQRDGIISVIDVGPTLLDLSRIPRPTHMEGRAATFVASDASINQRIADMTRHLDRARLRAATQTLHSDVVTWATVATLIAAGFALFGRRGAGSVAAGLAIATYAFIVVSYLVSSPFLNDSSSRWWLTLGGATAGLFTVLWLLRPRPMAGLIGVLMGLAATVAVDLATGSSMQFGAAFGYSPTANSRIYGLSNFSFGVFAGSVLMVAGFVASRPGRATRGWTYGLLTLALVLIGGPSWGADVGGALAFAPGLTVFAMVAIGMRIRIRTLLLAALASVVAISAFTALDLMRPPGQRTHLGRLAERFTDEGWESMRVILTRKALGAFEASSPRWWIVTVAAIVVLVLLVRTRQWSRAITAYPGLRPAAYAAVVTAIAGTVLNDSGLAIGALILAILAPTLAIAATFGPGSGVVESAIHHGQDTPASSASSIMK